MNLRLSLILMLALLPLAAPARVEIKGLDKPLLENVRAWLRTDDLPDDAPRAAVHRAHRRAREDIRTALQALAHYQPQIHASLSFEESGWLAVYDIDPGPAARVREVRIDYRGEGGEQLRELVPTPNWRGQILDHGQYGALKDRLLNAAIEAGFLDAELVESQLRIDVDANAADVVMAIDTGPQYVFGSVKIEQDILAEDFLDNYIQIRPGDIYSAERLLELQLRLTDLDYFKSLDMDTTQVAGNPPSVDVRILGTPPPPQHYQIGLGYGTDTGARFSASSEFRRLNRRGHRLRNSLRIAETQRQVTARYVIPTGREIGSNWSVQSQYLQERFADARSEDLELGVIRTLLSGPGLWQLYLKYRLENFKIGDTRDQTELLLPGLSLSLRSADDSLNPRRGYKLFADLRGAHDDVASSDSFVRTLLQAHWLQPLSGRSRLLLRGQLGTSFVGEISQLPLSQRFFAGGDQSVRGYAYQSLGPINEDGDVVGGKYLAVVSAEIDRLIWRDYGAAVFYDYGGASDTRFGDLFRGVGVGLRVRTGIGMLRIDVAKPLDKPDGSLRLHIGIGAEL